MWKGSLRTLSHTFIRREGLGTRFTLYQYRDFLDAHMGPTSIVEVLPEINRLVHESWIAPEPFLDVNVVKHEADKRYDFAQQYLDNFGLAGPIPSWLKESGTWFRVLNCPDSGASTKKYRSLARAVSELGLDLDHIEPNVTTLFRKLGDDRLVIVWKRLRAKQPIFEIVRGKISDLVETVFGFVKKQEGAIGAATLIPLALGSRSASLSKTERTLLRWYKLQVSRILLKTRGVALPHKQDRDEISWPLPVVPPYLIKLPEIPPPPRQRDISPNACKR